MQKKKEMLRLQNQLSLFCTVSVKTKDSLSKTNVHSTKKAKCTVYCYLNVILRFKCHLPNMQPFHKKLNSSKAQVKPLPNLFFTKWCEKRRNEKYVRNLTNFNSPNLVASLWRTPSPAPPTAPPSPPTPPSPTATPTTSRPSPTTTTSHRHC